MTDILSVLGFGIACLLIVIGFALVLGFITIVIDLAKNAKYAIGAGIGYILIKKLIEKFKSDPR